MICYVCSRPATHRVYADLKPVCGKHLIESVCEEDGDILVSMIDTAPATCNPSANDTRIEEIKVELDILKAKKQAYTELTYILIGKIDVEGIHLKHEYHEKLSAQQDALFTEWKKLAEENYQTFQKWFDGLHMGVSK